MLLWLGQSVCFVQFALLPAVWPRHPLALLGVTRSKSLWSSGKLFRAWPRSLWKHQQALFHRCSLIHFELRLWKFLVNRTLLVCYRMAAAMLSLAIEDPHLPHCSRSWLYSRSTIIDASSIAPFEVCDKFSAEVRRIEKAYVKRYWHPQKRGNSPGRWKVLPGALPSAH